MMTATTHDKYRADMDHLAATLQSAAEHRDERQEFVPSGVGRQELGWVVFEWQTMCDEVNRLRARRGLGPVSIERIQRVESSACGHIDYVQKYAIGCADLVWSD